MTPFDDTGDLLWDDLERELDWIARAGAHGLIWPVNDSAQHVLAFPERLRGMKLAVDTIDGRIPVVMGVADTSKAGAVALAEAAGEAGADGVIALPPWAAKMTRRDLIEDYYRDIANAAGVPVFVQNLGGYMGSSLESDFVVELCRNIPLVQYVKEERNPHGTYVSEVIGLDDPAVKGVFTGGTILGLISGFRRGAAGNIAASYIADVDAQIWDLLEEGDEQGAREIQDAVAVLEKCIRDMPGGVGRQEILVRRGVFTSNAIRSVGRTVLDDEYVHELEYGLSRVEPYFKL
jgi:4-hydroxy-tetrahydrodipicolinate synthase